MAISLQRHFDDRLAALLRASGQPTAVLVGLSGGADSSALLRLSRASPLLHDRELSAMHVHHGLHPDADQWTRHCEVLCHELDLPLTTQRVQVPEGGGPEGAAREQRITVFEEALQSGGLLLLAHHRDDQAETLLLNLLRGCGLDGLAAMPELRRLGNGWLGRPLLDLTAVQLRDWLHSQGHSWIEDPANADATADRNFLRHRILPALSRRWPGSTRSLAETARLAGAERALLESQDRHELARLQGLDPATLDHDRWRRLPPMRRRRVLREWLRQLELPLPRRRQLENAMAQLAEPAPDAELRTAWPGAELRCYRGMIYAFSEAPETPPAGWSRPWDSPRIELPAGLGQLEWRDASGRVASTPPSDVRVSFREGGERLKPAGSSRSRPLKLLFQEAGIPPWERQRFPLLEHQGRLQAAADLWCSDDWIELRNQCGLREHWERG